MLLILGLDLDLIYQKMGPVDRSEKCTLSLGVSIQSTPILVKFIFLTGWLVLAS